MEYKRHYIQFNDFLFDGSTVISEDPSSVSFKSWSAEYTHRHGSYYPRKSMYGYTRERNVSLTVLLRYRDIPCDKRPFYRQFAISQFLKSGKLWAVSDGTLEWAYAEVTNISEQPSRKDRLEFDIDFVLPEGVWHKADKQRTFLVPFDRCDFMDCYEFKVIQPCVDAGPGSCCDCIKPEENAEACDCCNDCDTVTKEMALCYHMDEIQKFYECDGAGYKVVYDCLAANRFFNGLTHYMGTKFCTDCGGTIAGILYSDTETATSGITIHIHGKVKNPYIEINGNGNWIAGEYENLVINPDGSVYEESDCMACDPIDVSAWNVPENMEYGWTINPGNNQIIIETGNCCETVCAYIEVDALAI